MKVRNRMVFYCIIFPHVNVLFKCKNNIWYGLGQMTEIYSGIDTVKIKLYVAASLKPEGW